MKQGHQTVSYYTLIIVQYYLVLVCYFLKDFFESDLPVVLFFVVI